MPSQMQLKLISATMRLNNSRLICAAAFGSLAGSSAFVTKPPIMPHLTHHHASSHAHGANNIIAQQQMVQRQSSRLFFSQKDDSDWQTFKQAGGNLLKKGADKIKSLVPFGKKSEKEKLAQQRKKEITGGISEMLRDAPLPIRLMGRMVAPLMSAAANEIAEQTAQAQDMLEEARLRMVSDPILSDVLGEPIQVGQPFAQSSSTTVINGQKTARLQASFQVVGNKQGGVATLESSNGEILSLTVNVNGRNISVNARGGKSIYGKASSKDDNIIEAEIIEKK